MTWHPKDPEEWKGGKKRTNYAIDLSGYTPEGVYWYLYFTYGRGCLCAMMDARKQWEKEHPGYYGP